MNIKKDIQKQTTKTLEFTRDVLISVGLKENKLAVILAETEYELNKRKKEKKRLNR